MTYLRAQFDEDDLDNDDDDVELELDSDKDYELSDSEDEEFVVKKTRRSKKKVKFDAKQVPGAMPVNPPEPTPIDTLTRQMEDLRIGQAMLLQELSAVKSVNNGGRYNNGQPPPQSQERRCFICDGIEVHRLGIRDYHGWPSSG